MKVAGCPATTETVRATSFASDGATGVTFSVAAALCAVPPAFVTVTVKLAPSSLSWAAGSVYVAAVAPGTADPPRNHW